MKRSIFASGTVARSALAGATFLLLQLGPRAQGAAEVPEGLSTADWGGIREAHEEGRYAAVETDDGYRARNPGQQWLTHFDGRGFSVLPDAGGWTWGLELSGYGFAGAERAVEGPASVSVEGQSVAYEWDSALEEWYVNDARGLEHGYTVGARPAPDAGSEPGPLTFTLAIRGELCAEVQDGSRGVRFVNGDGALVLTYSGLIVLDADGQSLPARLDPVTEGLRLSIDERGARYPLSIDPVAQLAYLKASNTGSADSFGSTVSVSDDTVVVGAYGENSNATGVNGAENDESANDAGAAYVFVGASTTWSQQAYLKASNTSASDEFGYSVSVSGDTVVVGAPGEDSNATGVDGNQSDNSASSSGAAYVFVRSGTVWSQQAYLKASNTDAGDNFGFSVSVSGDTVVIGAQGEDSNDDGDPSNNSASSAGAAYAFVRSGTTWTQQAYLKAKNPGDGDLFGWSVSVSGDTLVAGAVHESSNATGVDGDQDNDLAVGAGAAYVFDRSGTSWNLDVYLKASNTQAADQFGFSVSVVGSRVVVGAPQEDSNATGVEGDQSDNSAQSSGAVYVFSRSGASWSQQAYLKASNTEAGDGFGSSVSPVSKGDTLLVGAPFEDSSATGVDGNQSDNTASDAGAVYAFFASGEKWQPLAYVKASNTGAADAFGRAVATAEKSITVAGADKESSSATGVNGDQSNDNAPDSGAAYVIDVPPPLEADLEAISLGPGGVQTLDLDAGADEAFGLYYLLSTTTGTSPGLPLTPSSLTLPLNFSSLLLFTALNPNVLIPGSLAFLDASGQGTTAFALAPGLDPGLAGVTLHHA